MTERVTIDRRFRGPSDSGNGGYVCGVVAALVGGPAEVTLRSPPPLDRPSARAAFGGVQRNTKRKARRQNVSYFGIWNQEKKTILQEWERALRGALGSPGG